MRISVRADNDNILYVSAERTATGWMSKEQERTRVRRWFASGFRANGGDGIPTKVISDAAGEPPPPLWQARAVYDKIQVKVKVSDHSTPTIGQSARTPSMRASEIVAWGQLVLLVRSDRDGVGSKSTRRPSGIDNEIRFGCAFSFSWGFMAYRELSAHSYPRTHTSISE